MITLQEFLTDEESVKAYKAWLQNPITRQIFEFAQQQIQKSLAKQTPPIEGAETLQRAAILYSITYGRQELLEFISTLDTLAIPSGEMVTPEANYGANDILMRDFYDVTTTL